MISIKAEPTCGTDIETASKECIELARRLNVNVEFTFNTVLLFAKPSNNYQDIVKSFHQQISNKT